MVVLHTYLRGIQAIHATGEAVEETSYYGQLEALLNTVGKSLSPAVTCVLTTKNRGAGLPDGGLFVTRKAVHADGESVLKARAPERGVVEVKGPTQAVEQVARSAQVRRYLDRYGKVMVTNYRDFLVLRIGSDGQPQTGERFTLAQDADLLWNMSPADADAAMGANFVAFLERTLKGDAPLSDPADLAWFLAAYARTGLQRVENAGDMEVLSTLRSALEDALGIRFKDQDGDHFFRSALVQTLFYGVFAAWVFWSEKQEQGSTNRFNWRMAQWTLPVPMIRVLFQQLTTPANLPVGLDEVLDWTDDVFSRVDRNLFFQRFKADEAVQFFYEPFLHAYDPELRRELGVWYTPQQVVRYMVENVDERLRTDLEIPLGLADPRVHVLDPCTGTGSYLTAALDRIVKTLREHSDDGLVPTDAKEAALSRLHGFELLPAPFVVAHLRFGLTLARIGAPLDTKAGERAGVFLTNSLTGWVDSKSPHLPFPEFEIERDAADSVKKEQPILVIIGNPPYNGFAGVSGEEEHGLVEPYKVDLGKKWDITKNKLDDLYIRFFRIAERRIAEQTGKGIVCLITNSSWLGDPSAVVMRERLLRHFTTITVDHLNGDSRETGKKTPEGLPDPSVFSTKFNPQGITRGVAISTLVRRDGHEAGMASVGYRDFWGQNKPYQLEEAIADPGAAPSYSPLSPDASNWFRLLRWRTGSGYSKWPSIVDLCATDPMLGLNENRKFALIDTDKDMLSKRIQQYLDKSIEIHEVDPRLSQEYSGFKPDAVRSRLLKKPFDESRVKRFQFRPLDMRYAYVETEGGLWNRSRPLLVSAAEANSGFLLVRRRAPRALDGSTFHYSNHLVDQKVLFTDAYAVPFWLAGDTKNREDDADALFSLEPESADTDWKPNLSKFAVDYLAMIGISDPYSSKDSATLLWYHALAVGSSPLYVEQNGDAVRSDWPRIPLPRTAQGLRESAKMGRTIAGLLDTDVSIQTSSPELAAKVQDVAVIERVDKEPINPARGDLAITAGWGIVQPRAVMPGSGKYEVQELDSAGSNQQDAGTAESLGEQIINVYLNDEVRWGRIPAAAWDFKIGGFQVLRKWLSYRDKKVLGRDLTTAEVRTFTDVARRVAAVALLSSELDANYLRAVQDGIDKE